jgi:hypothetical protein
MFPRLNSCFPNRPRVRADTQTSGGFLGAELVVKVANHLTHWRKAHHGLQRGRIKSAGSSCARRAAQRRQSRKDKRSGKLRGFRRRPNPKPPWPELGTPFGFANQTVRSRRVGLWELALVGSRPSYRHSRSLRLSPRTSQQETPSLAPASGAGCKRWSARVSQFSYRSSGVVAPVENWFLRVTFCRSCRRRGF